MDLCILYIMLYCHVVVLRIDTQAIIYFTVPFLYSYMHCVM